MVRGQRVVGGEDVPNDITLQPVFYETAANSQAQT